MKKVITAGLTVFPASAKATTINASNGTIDTTYHNVPCVIIEAAATTDYAHASTAAATTSDGTSIRYNINKSFDA